MERAALKARIAEGESLTLEFKGEERNALNDRDLVEAVVCMANAVGGLLLVGVEEQMIVLNRLFHERRVTTEQVATEIQRSQNEARALLERLVEEGMVDARGEKRGRVYHLAARLYNELGQPEAYVHVHGMEPLRQEALVEEYVRAHGSIRRAKATELCGLSERQATLLLKKMVDKSKLVPYGERNSRTYTLSRSISSESV